MQTAKCALIGSLIFGILGLGVGGLIAIIAASMVLCCGSKDASCVKSTMIVAAVFAGLEFAALVGAGGYYMYLGGVVATYARPVRRTRHSTRSAFDIVSAARRKHTRSRRS